MIRLTCAIQRVAVEIEKMQSRQIWMVVGNAGKICLGMLLSDVAQSATYSGLDHKVRNQFQVDISDLQYQCNFILQERWGNEGSPVNWNLTPSGENFWPTVLLVEPMMVQYVVCLSVVCL